MAKLIPDDGEFRMRLVDEVGQPVGAAIPIAGVAQVALNLMQHRMNPGGGGIVLVALNDLMRGIPFTGESQFNRPQQLVFWHAHGPVLTLNQPGGKPAENTRNRGPHDWYLIRSHGKSLPVIAAKDEEKAQASKDCDGGTGGSGVLERQLFHYENN